MIALTYNDYLERAAKKFAAEVIPVEPPASVSSLDKSTFKKSTSTYRASAKKNGNPESIQELLAILTESSAGEQISAYNKKHGDGAWPEQFVVAARLPDPLEIWKQVPNCSFKRFQECFVPPERRIIPIDVLPSEVQIALRTRAKQPFYPFKSLAHGHLIALHAKYHWTELSVEGCLPRGDMISTHLAVKSKFIKLENEENVKLSPREILRAKNSLDTLTKFKLLWDVAKPLHNQDQRILRIPLGLHRDSPLKHLEGSMLSVQEHASGPITTPLGPKVSVRRTVNLFTSAYRASKKTSRAKEGYGDELRQIVESITEIERLADAIDSQWRKGCDPSIKDELRAEALKIQAKKSQPTVKTLNQFKKKALTYLEKGFSIQDRTKKDNPSVAVNQLNHAKRQLESRINEIFAKDSYVQRDSRFIESAVQKQEFILEQFAIRLRGKCRLLNSSAALFKDRTLKDEGLKLQATGLLASLQINPRTLEGLTLRPFISYGRSLHTEFEKLKASVFTKALSPSQDIVNRMELIVQHFEAQQRFECFRSLATMKLGFYAEELIDALHSVSACFTKGVPFPQAKNEPLYLGLEEIEQKCTELESKINAEVGPGSGRSKPSKDLLKAIKDINIERIFLKARRASLESHKAATS